MKSLISALEKNILIVFVCALLFIAQFAVASEEHSKKTCRNLLRSAPYEAAFTDEITFKLVDLIYGPEMRRIHENKIIIEKEIIAAAGFYKNSDKSAMGKQLNLFGTYIEIYDKAQYETDTTTSPLDTVIELTSSLTNGDELYSIVGKCAHAKNINYCHDFDVIIKNGASIVFQGIFKGESSRN
ncbi:MAG: hypothetical protein A2Z20_06085 [Bdellovibrionales bacterium RBG_16_40_8]|nr:MAG: hypothetical protein A2Z20_06085 [Bdellovibrionales bacterium RBG_16_40_8]